MTNNISIYDRCFLYGDGFFSTVRVSNGLPQHWPLHLARLQQSATTLGIDIADWQALTLAVTDAISLQNTLNGVLKVQISRGAAGRGYSPDNTGPANIYISQSTLPDYQHVRQYGVVLALAEFRLAVQPALAGLKHCNRLEQVLLKREASARNVDDLLVCDQQGFVTEAIAANVFMHRHGQWYTPRLARAGVAGVMRSHIMQCRADIAQVDWQEAELADVDAMVLTNALMGPVPVQLYNNRTLDLKLAKTWCNEFL